MNIDKLTKEQFWAILDFLSRHGGFTDLGDEDMKLELWKNYENGELI